MTSLPVALSLFLAATPTPAKWQTLEPGLELLEWRLPATSSHGDSTSTVVRVKPGRLLVEMLGVDRGDSPRSKPAPQWAKDSGLAVVVNAGMFSEDMRTPVGFCRMGSKAINPKWKSGYKAVLALVPVVKGVPSVRILDGECDDVSKELSSYVSALQSIRMVTCARKNAWGASAKRWSSVIVATDSSDRVLFIHTRSPYSMRELIGQLLAAPLDIQRAMYLEGGPEASLFVSAGGRTIERIGSYETGFNENDDNRAFWDLPNVIWVRSR